MKECFTDEKNADISLRYHHFNFFKGPGKDCPLTCSGLILLHDLTVGLADRVAASNKLVVFVLGFVLKYFYITLKSIRI